MGLPNLTWDLCTTRWFWHFDLDNLNIETSPLLGLETIHGNYFIFLEHIILMKDLSPLWNYFDILTFKPWNYGIRHDNCDLGDCLATIHTSCTWQRLHIFRAVQHYMVPVHCWDIWKFGPVTLKFMTFTLKIFYVLWAYEHNMGVMGPMHWRWCWPFNL